MRIGLDFDNTIVNYDKVFHRVAIEQGVIPPELPANKIIIRDYLRSVDQENIWTEMQGTVYGARMDEAEAYPGVLEFIHRANQAGHILAIVSHKTRHNYLGPKYDLHAAARSWVERYLCEAGHPFIPEDRVFFELTKEEKLARIDDFCCDIFIDDLPEILLAPSFPAATKRFLFDPQSHHKGLPDLEAFSSWPALEKHVGL